MIVTVTMNPAIDRTVDLGELKRGGLNRIRRSVLDAGGKGINVSKTVKALGGTTIAAGFLGGSSGDVIEKALKDYGIKSEFVRVQGETRTNLKIVEQGGIVTELNEPGPMVTEEQTNDLIARLEGYASEETLFVLAGSIPGGIGKEIYRVITERVHARGASVLLDADGELFANSLAAGPDIIKPNCMELEEYYHMNCHASEEQLADLGGRLLEQGVSLAVVSMGQRGALFLGKERKYRCRGLSVEVHSTVGAGDAMVAALAYGWDRKMSLEESVTLGMAVSAGAVMTQGTRPPTREVVDELLAQVHLEML